MVEKRNFLSVHYEDPEEALHNIGKYLGFYNTKRPHNALGMRTPEEVYLSVN
ncbi:MAG: hypothetical protein COS94_04950 [Candidatus Hydrogenedentes bacterium CG07_land_8_20_14_0_80_42_17]|nr:MAG: hypothetical protein COS94_04950 [Candidatus Hydrogenedentes bacterium CG07_land_8_20_14_0_80_42_17]